MFKLYINYALCFIIVYKHTHSNNKRAFVCVAVCVRCTSFLLRAVLMLVGLACPPMPDEQTLHILNIFVTH